jgi:putative ABC transport system ATP-binding protein
MLKLNSVNKTFNKNSLDEYKALDNVNLHLAEGEFVTVIGGNGAGKKHLPGRPPCRGDV